MEVKAKRYRNSEKGAIISQHTEKRLGFTLQDEFHLGLGEQISID